MINNLMMIIPTDRPEDFSLALPMLMLTVRNTHFQGK